MNRRSTKGQVFDLTASEINMAAFSSHFKLC